MDSFEWNKIAGGVLAALLVIVTLHAFGPIPFEVEGPHTRAYPVAVPEAETASEPAAPADAGPQKSIVELLASASVDEGAKVAKKCVSCHAFEKGAAAKVGPPLWGVVGAAIGSHVPGFGYSEALKAKGAGGGVWGFEELAAWLTDPKAFAKGNKMAFAGLGKAEERAQVIAYLRSLSDSPVPLPK
jgi:cytochrome c